jgi:pilus assembly protein CpaE
MQRRSLQLVVITEHPYRAEMVEYLAAGKGWTVHRLLGRPDLGALHQQPMDLVLVDLDLPGAVALISELAHEFPVTPLLALATSHHLVEVQDARLAGAADFVAFPIQHHYFFVAIERALQVAHPPTVTNQTGRMVAVAGLKGGVGRSTLAVNLAVALAGRKQGEVILAEAHHGLGQLALMLNVRPRHHLAGLVGEANLDLDLMRGYLQPHESGVRLLAAPGEPAQLAELTPEMWGQVLGLLADLAPLVVVDTAPVADAALEQVLTRADEILLVMDATIASLYQARSLLQMLRSQPGVGGRIHLVCNQAGLKGGLSTSVIEKHLGEPLAVSIEADAPMATFAFNRGIPFVLSHPTAVASRKIQKLADYLLAERKAGEQPATHRLPSFLSFWSWGRQERVRG